MPPRIRRQSPQRRDAAIRKHLPQAGAYWSKWPQYLSAGDLCQAGEKAWGAVAQLTKAVAAHRGWQHSDHDRLREVIRELANESVANRETITRGLTAADILHGNFYEIFLDRSRPNWPLPTWPLWSQSCGLSCPTNTRTAYLLTNGQPGAQSTARQTD